MSASRRSTVVSTCCPASDPPRDRGRTGAVDRLHQLPRPVPRWNTFCLEVPKSVAPLVDTRNDTHRHLLALCEQPLPRSAPGSPGIEHRKILWSSGPGGCTLLGTGCYLPCPETEGALTRNITTWLTHSSPMPRHDGDRLSPLAWRPNPYLIGGNGLAPMSRFDENPRTGERE